MGLRRDVKTLLVRVTQLLEETYGHRRVMDLLSKENQRLREENQRMRIQNNQLFDRLMARNFEAYAVYKEEDTPSGASNPYFSMGSNNEPNQNEANIGEVVEDETVR